MNEVAASVSALANIVMAVGVFFVWKQLKLLKQQINDDHERSRKQTLIDVMREWNREIGPATAAAQKLISNLDEDSCRKIANIQPVRISRDNFPMLSAAFEGKLKKDESATKESVYELSVEQSAHLRFLVIEYLNALETSLSAWKLGIVDLETMEEEFSFLIDNSMSDPALTRFRKILGSHDGFPALRAFLKHVKEKNNGASPDQALGK